MELKLEDYARRIDRFYYEIMREYADGAPTTKDLEIFIRPDSGYLVVWHFCLQNDETYFGVDRKHSLRGTDCNVPKEKLRDMGKNPEPPWFFQKTPADTLDKLPLVPSFVYSKYTPKNDIEYFKFSILEPMNIHLSNVWVREKHIESEKLEKSMKKSCILWKGKPEILEKLAVLLYEAKYIKSPSVWLDHFNNDPLKTTEAPPIKWGKNKYELYYLLRHLNNYEIRESYSIHFEGIKQKPWSGSKPTEKLDTIEAILIQVN